MPTTVIGKCLMISLAVGTRYLVLFGGKRALLCSSGEIWTDFNGEEWTAMKISKT